MDSVAAWPHGRRARFCDLLPAGALVALVEPRRLRDRAQALSTKRPRLARRRAQLRCNRNSPSDTLALAPVLPAASLSPPIRTRSRSLPSRAVPRRRPSPRSVRPDVGDSRASPAHHGLKSDGYRLIVSAEARPQGAHETCSRPRAAGRLRDRAPIDRGVGLPTHHFALSPRGRSHRPPPLHRSREARAKGVDHYRSRTERLRRAPPCTASASTWALETREMFGVRRYRPSSTFQGATGLRRLPRTRSSASTPVAKIRSSVEDGRRRLGENRARVRKAVPGARGRGFVLYRPASRRRATRSRRHPFQHRSRTRSLTRRRPTRQPANRRDESRHGAASRGQRLICGAVANGKTGGSRCVWRGQSGGSTASTARSSCRQRCSRSSTGQRSASASPTTRCASKCCPRFPDAEGQNELQWLSDGTSDIVIGTTANLLSATFASNDLGLLVVYENSAFGGATPEKIPQVAHPTSTFSRSPRRRSLERWRGRLTGISDLSPGPRPP